MNRTPSIASTLLALAIGLLGLGAGEARAQAGPLGASIQQYAGGTRWPDVAYDSYNHVYLVVWGPGTIRGIFVDENGTAIGSSFRISDASPWAQTPRVAFSPNSGAFLVTWQSSDGITGNASATVVRGRTVTFTGGASPLPTQAYSGTTYSTRWETGPALAYSPASGRFMVVWNRYSASGAEVGARLVDDAANPVGGEIVVTSTSDEYEREPTVGYLPGSNRFLVAWAASASASDLVRGKVYDASSGTENGASLLFAQSRFTYVPEASLNITTGELLVTWMQDDAATALPGNGWRPFGRLVNGNGAFVSTSSTRLSSIVGAYDANSVAFNALTQSFFLVTHGASTLQDVGFEISASGAPVSTAGVVTSVTATNLTGSFNPRIGASAQQAKWLMGTSASFTSLWTQVIAGNGVAPPPGGGGGTPNPQLTIAPMPTGGTVTGGGLTCGTGGTTCQLTFTQSTAVTLTATADEGFQFNAWGGSCSGTNPTTTVQVDAYKTCSATFVAAWGGPGQEPPGCLAAPAPVFPAQPGPIGASVNQYTGGTQYTDTAYNQCQQVYLTVWGLGGTIRGRFVSENGEGVGDVFPVSSGQWAQTPKVIYNPNIGNFLVVWHSSATDSRTEVRAALVTYPAGPSAVGTVLSATTYSTRWITRPAIGYSPNSGQYLVAWPRYSASGADVNARFVDTQSVPTAAEFAVTSTSDEYEREPTVGHLPGTDRMVVAYSASGSASDFVRAKLYDVPTGSAFGSTLTLAQTKFTYVPEAALNTNTGNVFVAWMQDDAATALPGNGWRPFGNGITPAGQLVFTSGRRLSSTAGAYDANAIDYNPISRTFFLITHGATTYQDVGFEIGGDGTSIGTAATVTSITWPNLNGAFNPRIAASTRQPRWLVSTAASFQSMWTQLVGGTDTGSFGSFSVTISPAPVGGTVTGSGLNCGTGGTACSVTFASSTLVTLTATADTTYVFLGWSGACSGTAATTTVQADSAKTCTAAFGPSGPPPTSYTLAISPTPANGTVAGGGIACGTGGAVCQVDVPTGTSVTLTATAASGYSFTGWGGNCSGTSATTTVLMNAAKSCSATFTAGLPTGPPYTMTISPKPTGGTITGAGLNCGTGGNLCSVTMPASMPLGLSATPDAGYTFGAWTGDCSGFTTGITVQLAGARTCSASFVAAGTTFQLNVTPQPTGGTVTGGGIACGVGGATCQVTFGSTTAVSLTAAPVSGYSFTGWGGSCTGTALTTTVLVDGVRTCTATFTALPTYQLNVTPQPTGGTVTGGGLTCGTGGSTCQSTFGASTSVTLTAAADSGYNFTGWGGSCGGTAATTTVLVDAIKTCTASFAAGPVNGPPYTMTISPKPTGGTATGAGLNCGTNGSLCTASMPASMPYGMQATPDAGYTFSGWTGDCTGTSASLTIQLAGPRTCGAVFAPVGTTYRLTISPVPAGGTVDGGGIGCGVGGSTCQVTYQSLTLVTLAATPASGYSFTGWGGACSGTNTTTSVQVDGTKTCTATFTAIQTYQLTIAPVPAGGTVSGGGLTCGTGGATCQQTYGSSTSVTLTAVPATGYTFAAWGGSCSGTSTSTTVQVDAVKTCSATFTSGPVNGPPYTMTISPRPSGGTVTGAGLNCGVNGSLCTASMPASMPYGMSATPASGYTFGGWTGDCTGTNPSLTIQLAGPRTCGATFNPVGGTTYQLTISPVPTGGTVSGGGLTCGTGGSTCQQTYGSSTSVTLTAAPTTGYTFTGWGGACSGTNTTTSLQVDGTKTCTASFAAIQTYQLTIAPVPTGGTVSGGGLTCGTGGSTCQQTYGSSTSVTLTAAPATGYTFTGWGGNCAGTATTTTVQVDAIKTCSATFTTGPVSGPPYTMTISPRPTGGTVTGAGLNCGVNSALCTASMPASMPYGMSAAPASGFVFGGWTGDCAGTNPSLYIQLAGPRTCGAIFTPVGGGSN